VIGVLFMIAAYVAAWFLLAGRRQQRDDVADAEFDTDPQGSEISFDEADEKDEYLTACRETDDAIIGEFGAAGTFGMGIEEGFVGGLPFYTGSGHCSWDFL
jgi:hypothetical protein